MKTPLHLSPHDPDASAAPAFGERAFGRFALHKAQRWLRVDGQLAKVSPRAFDVLCALIDNGERMVSKSELLDIVWPTQVVEEANVHVHVSALRKLLGPDVIATVPGRGYRFVHPLQAPSESASDGAAALPPEARPGNLQVSPPSLYGRAADLAALCAEIRAHRLVTLLGTGGIGKTSLALNAANADREAWRDGVWFVDLAPVEDAAHVPAAVARSLGIALPAHRDPARELTQALAPRSMLVVLDNAEHVVEGTASLAALLLAGSTRVSLLVTSRQALRLPEERRIQVRPLAVPADTRNGDDSRSFGAMALFEARASAIDPRFRLTDGNATAVADVCRHVDGVPLAIELAAARVQVLGLEGLRAGLLRSLRVLGPGNLRSGPRHRTLRATFDWTYDLLLPIERRLLRRLAPFVGGFTLKLAQDVAADAGEADAASGMLDAWGVLDGLDALIDKSLVVADGADPPRYRLLEVTRAYALEKLAEAGELGALSERHARAVRDLFAEAEFAKNERIRGALSLSRFLQLLAPELDNLRAARTWSAGPSGARMLAVSLAASASEALRMLGLSTEAMQSMHPLRTEVDELAAPETAELFWTGLCALGTHGRLPLPEMLEVIDKAERLYRKVSSPRRLHLGLYRKGFALMHLGRCEEGQLATAEMARLERPDWPPKAAALRLNLQAGLDGMRGRYEESIDAFTRAADLLRSVPGEEDFVLNTLTNLCLSVLFTHRHEEALSIARHVLEQRPSPVVRNSANRAALTALTFLGRSEEASVVGRQAMRDWRSDDLLPYMLGVFAWLAYQQGRTADAVRLDGAARTHVLRKALPDSPVTDLARGRLREAMKAHAGTDDELGRWREQGEQAHEDEFVAWCLGDGAGAVADPGAERHKPLVAGSMP